MLRTAYVYGGTASTVSPAQVFLRLRVTRPRERSEHHVIPRSWVTSRTEPRSAPRKVASDPKLARIAECGVSILWDALRCSTASGQRVIGFRQAWRISAGGSINRAQAERSF